MGFGAHWTSHLHAVFHFPRASTLLWFVFLLREKGASRVWDYKSLALALEKQVRICAGVE